jgi:hypothetical protein
MDAELTLQEALVAIAQTTQLDLIPVPMPTRDRVKEAILRERQAAIPALEELASNGAPTARVRAVLLLRELSPAAAEAQLSKMLDDPSPIVVNTCLVGYRRLSDWARSQTLQEAPTKPAPTAPPDATAARKVWVFGTVIALVIAALTTLALVFTRCR